MNTTYELNNICKDSEYFDGKFTKTSPVVEVFSAMVNGEEISKFGAKGDKAVEYIKELGERAGSGDYTAVAELNTLRKFIIEAPVMEQMKLLGVFGAYQKVGMEDSIEREVHSFAGELSREQAYAGDVVFPVHKKEKYPVPTTTISGGYAIDYRKIAAGDMSKENEGLALVKTDILNNSVLYVIKKVYDAIKHATGVKYWLEAAGITKQGVDGVLTKIRRFGRPTVIGDYAFLSQFTPWAGYVGSINNNTITGISQKALEEIAQNGGVSMYNGAVLKEISNPYNEYKLNSNGTDFETLLPAGLGIIVPTGTKSPVATWTRGGLTSFTGNNVKTGQVETRFDIEVACDVAKGQEYKIGAIYDKNIGGLD